MFFIDSRLEILLHLISIILLAYLIHLVFKDRTLKS